MTGSRSGTPPGLPVVLDPDVRRFEAGRVLLGGDPGRLVRLRPDGAMVLDRLAAGEPVAAVALALARSLVDGGLAHPRPAAGAGNVTDVTVIIPVRDRVEELARCLRALGRGAPVLVIDDGSRDPAAVAAVCRDAGARLLRRDVNEGPAAARNAGLAATSSALVAFLDSDCVPPSDWLPALLGHFADPSVGAVAPRVRGRAGGAALVARYAADRGPLDMGPREAHVRPGGRVPYVPTAALVVRRTALPAGAPFDPSLRYGEDVDLVWRLHDAGWSVRYDPRTVVTHEEPDRWPAWLARRYRYGTSAAPLARRHGGRLAPLVLPPWLATAWLLLLSGRPLPATVMAGVPAVRLHRRLRRTGLPFSTSAITSTRVTGQGVVATGRGLGGAGSVVAGPVLVALLAGRRSRRAAAVALLTPPLLEWATRRPAIDPVRWSAIRLVDDLAYAVGVWRSCLGARTLSPLRPRTRRPS